MNLEKIVFHIGPGKTGTTSLQTALSESANALLEEHGVFYPAGIAVRGVLEPSKYSNQLPELKSALEKNPSARIGFFSSEFVTEPNQILEVAAHLGVGRHRVQVVYVVRSPSELWLSMLQQHLKYFRHISIEPTRYSILVPPFEEIFMTHGFQLLDSQERLDTFLEYTIGTSVPKRKNQNISPSFEATYLLQQFHQKFFPNDIRRPTRQATMFWRILQRIEMGQVTKKSPLREPYDSFAQMLDFEEGQFLERRGLEISPVNNDVESKIHRTSRDFSRPKFIQEVVEIDFTLVSRLLDRAIPESNLVPELERFPLATLREYFE